MTNPATKQQYEGAILQQLVKNAEKLAVIEFEFNQFKPKINKIDNLEQKLNTIEKDFTGVKQDLIEIKEVIKQIKLLLGWLKWIGGAVITIALSLVANFVYSLVT